jgi:hypothetical protein
VFAKSVSIKKKMQTSNICFEDGNVDIHVKEGFGPVQNDVGHSLEFTVVAHHSQSVQGINQRQRITETQTLFDVISCACQIGLFITGMNK